MSQHRAIATPGWAPPATPETAGTPHKPAQRPDDLLLGIWTTDEPGLLVGPFHFTLSRLAQMQHLMRHGEPGAPAGSRNDVCRKALSRRGRATTSVYKGVNLHSRCNRWDAHIWDSRQVHVGCFMCEIQAAVAYDLMAIKVRGPKTSNTNFPTSLYQQEIKELEQIPKCDLLRTLRKSAARMNAALDLLPPASPIHQHIKTFMQQPPSTSWFAKAEEVKAEATPSPTTSSGAPMPTTPPNAAPSTTSTPSPTARLPAKRSLEEHISAGPLAGPAPPFTHNPSANDATHHGPHPHSRPAAIPVLPSKHFAPPGPNPATPRPSPFAGSLPPLVKHEHLPSPTSSLQDPPAKRHRPLPSPLPSLPSRDTSTPTTLHTHLDTHSYDATCSWLAENFPHHTDAPHPFSRTPHYPHHPARSHAPAPHPAPLCLPGTSSLSLSEPSSPHQATHCHSTPHPAAPSKYPLSPQTHSTQETHSASDASTASCCHFPSPLVAALDPPAAAFYAHHSRSSASHQLASPRAPRHPHSPTEVFSPRSHPHPYPPSRHPSCTLPAPTHSHYSAQSDLAHHHPGQDPDYPYPVYPSPSPSHWHPSHPTHHPHATPSQSAVFSASQGNQGCGAAWAGHQQRSGTLSAEQAAAHARARHTLSATTLLALERHRQQWQQECHLTHGDLPYPEAAAAHAPHPRSTPAPTTTHDDCESTQELCHQLLQRIDPTRCHPAHGAAAPNPHGTRCLSLLTPEPIEHCEAGPQYSHQAPHRHYPQQAPPHYAAECGLPPHYAHHPADQGSLPSQYREQAPADLCSMPSQYRGQAPADQSSLPSQYRSAHTRAAHSSPAPEPHLPYFPHAAHGPGPELCGAPPCYPQQGAAPPADLSSMPSQYREPAPGASRARPDPCFAPARPHAEPPTPRHASAEQHMLPRPQQRPQVAQAASDQCARAPAHPTQAAHCTAEPPRSPTPHAGHRSPEPGCLSPGFAQQPPFQAPEELWALPPSGSSHDMAGGLPPLFAVEGEAWGQPAGAASEWAPSPQPADACGPQSGTDQGWLNGMDIFDELLGEC